MIWHLIFCILIYNRQQWLSLVLSGVATILQREEFDWSTDRKAVQWCAWPQIGFLESIMGLMYCIVICHLMFWNFRYGVTPENFVEYFLHFDDFFIGRLILFFRKEIQWCRLSNFVRTLHAILCILSVIYHNGF